ALASGMTSDMQKL
ncbi:hypothetical protein A2U01_0117076, partial [Trifolium medium]|nr:hypothetical protein [Trifolium medium]